MSSFPAAISNSPFPAPSGAALSPSSPPRRADPVIDEIVRDLCVIHHHHGLQMHLDIGALVVEKLFRGDAERIHKRGRKDRSLRKLAAHPSLPFSAATLWRAIAIYDIVRRFPEVVRAKNLSVSHIRAVAGLPPHLQQTLLTTAEMENWDLPTLESAVARGQFLNKKRGGRPRQSDLAKLGTRIEKIVRTRKPEGLAVDNLDDMQRERLKLSVFTLRDWCNQLLCQLDVLEHPQAVNE